MSNQRRSPKEWLAIQPGRFQVFTPVQRFFVWAALKLMRLLVFEKNGQMIAVVPDSDREAFNSLLAKNGLTAKLWS